MDDPKHLKGEKYLSFVLLILALMAFAVIVKSCNIAQYQHQQLQHQQQVTNHESSAE